MPPILNVGSEQLQEKCLPELLLGKTRSCIAITEPDAGSDVANGKEITRGETIHHKGHQEIDLERRWTDYSTMAVRTGGRGAESPLLNNPPSDIASRRLLRFSKVGKPGLINLSIG